MNKKLQEILGRTYDKMEEHLAGLSPKQQQHYLQGMFDVIDAYFRLADPLVLTPIERAMFMNHFISQVYSKAIMLNLDVSKMDDVMEHQWKHIAISYTSAIAMHDADRILLGPEELTDFQTVLAMAKMRDSKTSKEIITERYTSGNTDRGLEE